MLPNRVASVVVIAVFIKLRRLMAEEMFILIVLLIHHSKEGYHLFDIAVADLYEL